MFAGFHVFCWSLNSVLCEMEVVGRQADSVIRVLPLMVWQMGFQEKRCFRAFRWISLILLLGNIQCPCSGLCTDQECSLFFSMVWYSWGHQHFLLLDETEMIFLESWVCAVQAHWDPAQLGQWVPHWNSIFVPLLLLGLGWSLKSQTTKIIARFPHKNHLLHFRH